MISKEILVTGGAGFIGSHFCELLLSKGYSVICVDNFNDYYNPALKRKNIASFSTKSHFTLYEIDIRNPEIKEIFEKHDIKTIVHLAARAGVRASIEHPMLYEAVNIKGTLNLLEMALQFSIKHFIFASSSSVYGSRKQVPFSETDDVSKPISPYAATKRAGEMLCHTYHHLYNINISCLRFFTVYGPRGRPDMAPFIFTKNIFENKPIPVFGDGTAKRDFTFVKDIINGIYAAMSNNKGYEIFNLGNSKTVELSYFISLLEKYIGKKAKIKRLPPQPGDVPITFADLKKSKQMLGYDPQTSIETGLKIFVDWYRKHHL